MARHRHPSTALAVAPALALGAAPARGLAGADYVALPGGPFTSVLPQGATPTSSGPVDVAPFLLRATPVTVGEFRDFVVANPAWRRGTAPAVFADARYLVDWPAPLAPAADALQRPVTHVSWFAAQAFCETEGSRLPTWLEWESAAAADETRADARADPAWRRRILSWYERPADAPLPAVGGPPDVHGVRDLHGLVWEWVDDFNALFIAGDSRTQGDPDRLKFCGSGALAVVDRDAYAVLMRIALLASLGAAGTTGSLGFRCARPVAAPAPGDPP